MTSITDPVGNTFVKNIYDSQDRVTEQEDGLDDVWTYDYSPGETASPNPGAGKRNTASTPRPD